MVVGFVIGTGSLSLAYSASKEVIKVIKNKYSVEVNDNLVESDSFLYNDRIYIPLRAISESLGMDVEWDDNNKAVKIYNEDYDKTVYCNSDEFFYINIMFSMSPDEVVKVLGNPVSIEEKPVTSYVSLCYYYPDFMVGFSKKMNRKDGVYMIKINNENYQTANGVKIGDRLIDVVRKYGKPHYGEPDSIGRTDSNYLIYLDKNKEHAIEFLFDNEKTITEIIILDGLVG